MCESMTLSIAGNETCCTTLPLPQDVSTVLRDETLRCRPGHLAQLMADHTQLDWRPQLPLLHLPCLNVIGCRSGVFPVEGCEAVSQLIPGAIPTRLLQNCLEAACVATCKMLLIYRLRLRTCMLELMFN